MSTAAWQAINMPSNSVQPLATAAKTQLSPFYFSEKEKMKYMLRTSLYVMVKCSPASNQTLACMTWHKSILTTDVEFWILLEAFICQTLAMGTLDAAMYILLTYPKTLFTVVMHFWRYHKQAMKVFDHITSSTSLRLAFAWIRSIAASLCLCLQALRRGVVPSWITKRIIR